MKSRQTWTQRIEDAWTRKSVVWLQGVRRAGKTTVCRQLEDVEYFDCELPRVRRQLEDPEAFLADLRGRRVVLDEVHRLPNPAELLKIAADHHSRTKIVATGSSTLTASARFRDTLAGRKEEVWLTPMTVAEGDAFGNPSLDHRLVRGGLPPFFLADEFPERDFQEWMDAYWAKDIQELFRLERRASFQRFFELLLTDSGSLFEATRFSQACEVSRQTIQNYLAVLESTFIAHVIKPFSQRRTREIVAAPKVYGFDTGFVAYHRGWHDLRKEDFGPLWEHLVLNEMHATLQSRDVRYWRDKQGHEIDFILARRGARPIAIECKWSAGKFDPANLLIFRRHYPDGENYLVAHDVDRASSRTLDGVKLHVVNLDGLVERLGK
jgi:uncharacterized protein